LDGKKESNLSVMESGAYKCHRGHTPVEIREQLGEAKEQLVTPPPKKNTGSLTEAQVLENQENLKSGDNCLAWLLERNLDAMAIDHYQIGACRTKIGDRYYPAISVPVPDGNGLYHNIKRPIPWVPKEEQPPGYKKWSQWGVKATIWVTHEATVTPTEYWLVEGMWDAIALGWRVKNDLNLSTHITICTGTAGSGSVPDAFEIDEWMPVQCPIVIWYDKDEAGDEGAKKWKRKLPERVAIADIAFGETKPEGYDVSNALDAGTPLSVFAVEAFRAMQEAPTSDKPPTATQKKAENPLRAHLFKNDDYIAQAPDYIDWLVQDLLTPNELFVLGMPPRGGKSLFGLTLAKAIAGGTPFLDRPTTQGSVIYVNLEDGPTKVKIRQTQQDWAEGLPVYWLDRFKLSNLNHLKELVQEIGDVRLVILDTLSRVRDDGLDESSSKLSQVLEPLQEWTQEAGLCCVLMHHTRQQQAVENQSSDPFDSLRGSTAIRGTCRGAMVIIPAAESYRLIAENGYTDRLDLAVRLNPETLEWRLLGNWLPRIDGDMKTQILDLLNLTGESTVADIARNLNFNAASVSTIMSRLHRDEMVSKKGGKGRLAATYSRSSNLLKQQDLQFEHPNPITASDTSLLKQKNIPPVIETKSMQPPKSMQPMYQSDTKSDQMVSSSEHPLHTFPPVAYFSPGPLYVFEQSSNPGGASVPCSNSKSTSLSKLELGQSVAAQRRGAARIPNAMVTALNLPPVLDTYGNLSPGVRIRRGKDGKESFVVAESDCVRR
jgi:hypothetical protein